MYCLTYFGRPWQSYTLWQGPFYPNNIENPGWLKY
jgi:hypothetical protein